MNWRAHWRTPTIVASFALLAWVGFEIGRAGTIAPPAQVQAPTTLSGGVVTSKRIDGRAWTLNADKVSMSADQTTATVAHITDGRLHRPGKPDVLISADDVTVNTITSDLTVRGPVKVTEPQEHGPSRVFTTVGAQYYGQTHTLRLDKPTTIAQGPTTITVANATIDFAGGKAKLGRIVGDRSGSAP